MSNPVFSRSDVFGEPRRDGSVATQPAYGAYATPEEQTALRGTPMPLPANPAPAGQQDWAMARGPQAIYGAQPVAADVRPLTYDAVITKTSGLLALLVVVAAITWQFTSQAPWLVWAGLAVGFVLAMVNAIRRVPSPPLIIAYAVAEGVFVGGISYVFSNVVVDTDAGTVFLDSIVLQAVLATLTTFAVTLMLFKSGKVRVTPKFSRFLMIALPSYMLFSLVNLILVWTGALGGDGWGMRSGGWGVAIGLFAVGLAAMCLIKDFDSIKRGVENRVPAQYAWSAAFGLTVTLVWLYLEFLRIFAIINQRR